MSPAQRCARLMVLFGWMALLSYWSGQSNLPIDQPWVAGPLQGFQHRLAHLVAFGLLGLLARMAFGGFPRAMLLAVALTSAFGATDEWHQSFIPGRHSGIDDWALDTVFGALALFGWSRLSRTRWQPYARKLAPLGVGAAFVLGVGLAVGPNVALPLS
jgi:VanZ family protein